MRLRLRTLALAAALVGLASGCTETIRLPPELIGRPTPTITPAPTGTGTVTEPPAQGVDPLCRRPEASPEPAATGEELPPALAKVADQIQEIRGLRFKRPVSPEPVSAEEISRMLRTGINRSFPEEMMSRREKAWATIGVIPPGTDLRQSILDFAGSQFIGFYDTLSHQLVFIGSDNPTPYQKLILAHELTHALDDQHFTLSRLDQLEAECRDEELAAFVALTEGSARTMETRWAVTHLSSQEMVQVQQEALTFPPPPASVPEFLQNLLIFPYPNGQSFVGALMARGGTRAINDAFRQPPTSTEQVLHPEKYPSDKPQQVEVEKPLGLGEEWKDLDVLAVGEGWLRLMFDLRPSLVDAEEAADGWDGGEYRAWSNGSRVVVVMETVWDSPEEASEFADSLEEWGEGQQALDVSVSGAEVIASFGSDEETLAELMGEAA